MTEQYVSKRGRRYDAEFKHNAVGLVQNHFEILGITDGITREVPNKYGVPHPPKVFMELQYHNSPLRYRNIWIRKFGEQ